MAQVQRGGPPARRPAPPETGVALVKIGELLPAEPIRDLVGLDLALKNLDGVANVVTPLVQAEIPAMHQMSLRVVRIDPSLEGFDVYHDRRFCKDNERALGKRAILKLMAAAGVSKTDVQRVDDRRVPFFWEYKVTVQGTDADGHPRTEVAIKEVDLRDGAADTKKPEWICVQHGGADGCTCATGGGRWKKSGRTVALEPSALEEKRKHGAANAETKALLRALRELLTIPQKMTIGELELPFVVTKLVPLLDMTDPQTKAAVLEKAVWGTRQLYGAGVGPQGLPGDAPMAISAGTAQRVDDGIDDDRITFTEAGEAGPSGPEPPPPEGVEEGPPPPLDDPGTVRHPLACSCPHGCGEVLEAAQAKRSRERVGGLRCAACYPGPDFDFDLHAEGVSLGLPKYPNATPATVRGWTEARRRAGS